MTLPILRRHRDDDPTRCGCPLTDVPCDNPADGEDRLCSYCRAEHRPDFRQPFTEEFL